VLPAGTGHGLAKPVCGFISHCTSTLPPSVFPLGNVRLTIALRRFTINVLGRPYGITAS
jgi:hypothetical protein